MQKKALTIGLSAFATIFYFVIILYIFFAILHIDTLKNFETALAFELIGFFLLLYFILGNIILKPIKTGFYIPLLITTVAYTVLLDGLNIAFIVTMPNAYFVLVNVQRQIPNTTHWTFKQITVKIFWTGKSSDTFAMIYFFGLDLLKIFIARCLLEQRRQITSYLLFTGIES